MADDFSWCSIFCALIVAGLCCLLSFPDVQQSLAEAPVSAGIYGAN